MRFPVPLTNVAKTSNLLLEREVIYLASSLWNKTSLFVFRIKTFRYRGEFLLITSRIGPLVFDSLVTGLVSPAVG